MKVVVRETPPAGLSDSEKGIIFGVILGTVIGQFLAALLRSNNTASKVTKNVNKG